MVQRLLGRWQHRPCVAAHLCLTLHPGAAPTSGVATGNMPKYGGTCQDIMSWYRLDECHM